MRDPVVYFTFLFSLVEIQLLVWLIARDYTDVDWWKSAALAVLATVGACVITYFLPDVVESIAVGVAAAFGGWIINGFLYDELDWQRRLGISISIPIIGFGTLLMMSVLWIRFISENT